MVSEMGTPTKEQVYEEAKKLYFQHERRNGNRTSINPEYEELAESGFISLAQTNLMRNPETLYGIIEPKKKRDLIDIGESRYAEDLLNFPLKDIMRGGAFAVGARGYGKTNTLKLLVSEALRQKIEVKVFEPCLAWKDFPLPYIRVKRDSKRDLETNAYNCIYDLSRLSVLESRNFVAQTMVSDLQEAIMLTDLGKKPRCLFIIEEAQNVIMSNTLRHHKYQDVSRFITQSRNFGLSFVASTQRLASVDVLLVELSACRYWHRLEGQRNLQKARYWLDKYQVWNLRNLKVGEAYLQVGGKIKLVQFPKHEQKKEIGVIV